MPEYFVRTNSFAAPFFSDTDTAFAEAETPEAALLKLAATYQHPAKLFAAAVYSDATAYHKGAQPLARWLSNKAQLLEVHSGCSVYSKDAHTVEFDGVEHRLADPYGGSVVPSPGGHWLDDERREDEGIP